MNSRNLQKSVVRKWSVLLVILTVSAVAAAQKHGGSAPASHPAPAAHAAPAQHSAPAQHAGGNTGQRPGGAQGMNRGPGGATQNRPGGAAGANRGPGGNTGNRAGQAAGNRPGQTGNTGNRGGQTGGNRTGGAAQGANRGGAQTGNRGGAQTGNRGGAQAGNRGGAQAGNRGGQSAGNHQPKGATTRTTRSGAQVQSRANGQVRSIHTKSGMTINRGMHGGRNITSTHNGRTIVSHGRYGGYSQRAYFNRGGHSYYQRTYYRGGAYYAYGYRGYYYGGYPYYGYAPAYYWGPGYYGWAYNPWAVPVAYGWGWGGSPWFGFYGGWFAPYPVYAGAAFWLTDYLIAANLQAAYAAQQAAGDGGDQGFLTPQPQSGDEVASLWTTDPLIAANLETVYGAYMLGGGAPSGNAQLSPDVKQALSDEMKYEIGAEKDAAAAGQNAAGGGDQVPPALDPKIRIFVVSSDEDLTTSDGTECTLTAGDVIHRDTDTPDADKMVNATVKSSKKDECAVGATIAIAADELQEMHNQLRIQMDAGLKELADKQGKNGLPAAPDTKTHDGEVPAPQPDKTVQSDLQDQAKEADAAEADAKQQ